MLNHGVQVITMAKQGDQPAFNRARGVLLEPQLLSKLFGTIAQRYANRVGGYTRIHKFGNRPGDNAPHAILELVDNPQDIKFEMTARAVGWDLLAKHIKQGGPHKAMADGVEGVRDVIEQELKTGPGEKGELRALTRWNLQKVLRFRGEDAITELQKRAQDHIVCFQHLTMRLVLMISQDTLLAQPLALKTLVMEESEEKKDDKHTIVSPNSLKLKAGQTVPGGAQNTLRIAAAALGKDRRGPKWLMERRKLGVNKDFSNLWNTI